MRDYFYRAWKAILSYGSFGRSCSAVSHTFTSRLLDILLYSNNPSSLKENYAGHAGTVQCAQYRAINFSIHLHSNARDVFGFNFYQENFLIV